MKIFIIILCLESILIWLFISNLDLDPSVSILILLYVPGAIILNLVLAFCLSFRGDKFSKPLFLNALISPFLVYFTFNYQMEKAKKLSIKSYHFEFQHRKFELDFDLVNGQLVDGKYFSISERTSSRSSNGHTSGVYYQKSDSIFLKADTHLLILHNKILYKFQ